MCRDPLRWLALLVALFSFDPHAWAAEALSVTHRYLFAPQEGAFGGAWNATEAVTWRPFKGREGPFFGASKAGILFHPRQSGDLSWLNLVEGNLRFRFQPDWDSGEGPGNWASFLSVGAWTPDSSIGYWALIVDPKGEHLIFSVQAAGQGRTYLTVPYQFAAGQWYDIMLSYSPAATRLLIDGVEFGPGPGIEGGLTPDRTLVEEYGLHLGNNNDGNQPIRGVISQLSVLGKGEAGFAQRQDAFSLQARVSAGQSKVELSWPASGGQEVIQRRRLGKGEWSLLALHSGEGRYIDASPGLRSGDRYEYRIGERRIGVAVGRLEPTERRGRVLLVIADDAAKAVQREIDRFALDLVGDGWSVERSLVPRHEARMRSRYRRSIPNVKSRIESFYQQAPAELNVVILIGNVPIPYSGYRAEDGHQTRGDDHRGAWPCDAYYGDIDGLWTDEEVRHTNRVVRPNSNRPGDGKFDQDFLPSELELAVSRIDFSSLPSIDRSSLPGDPKRAIDVEFALLRRYFEKNHAYRHGRLSFDHRSVFKSYLPPGRSDRIERNAFRNAAALFGRSDHAITEKDCFLLSRPVKWGFLGGFGGPSSFGSGRYRTEVINQAGMSPQVAFLMLYGSWSADWNLKNSFTKAVLGVPETGLAVMSAIHGQWYLSSLALGEPLAKAYLETAGEVTRGGRIARSLAILGDATLRMDVVTPVGNLSGRDDSLGLRLTWLDPKGETDPTGCYVYRAAVQTGPYRRVSGPNPVLDGRFIDRVPNPREPFYMVRRAAEASSPAGRYINLSQGLVWERSRIPTGRGNARIK